MSQCFAWSSNLHHGRREIAGDEITSKGQDQLALRPRTAREGTRAMIPGTLVATLLTAISGYTGYAVPGEPPHIVALPHDALAQRVCGRPCPVLGFTLPNGEILIDDSLQIGSNPAATSILVHELTHFLQIRSVAHPAPLDCLQWNAREREAFEAQARWLRDNTDSIRAFSVQMAQLNWGVMHAFCPNGVPPAGFATGH
jgi:hypothetical protein